MTVDDMKERDRANILVVDDHPIVRRGIVMLLIAEPWVAEVHEASTASDAVKEALLRKADLVVMDLRLGAGDGVDAAAEILTARPSTAVVVVTMVADSQQVSRALAVGARGYLLKTSPPEELSTALQLAWRGGLVLGSGLGPAVLGRSSRSDWPPPFDRLTTGERELAQHLARGESNARIARVLGIADKTVRNRISALLVKLEVPDRVAAVIAARQVGLDADLPTRSATNP